MATVKSHTRKTKKGKVRVNAHTRYYAKVYGYGLDSKGAYKLIQVDQLEVSQDKFSKLKPKHRFKESLTWKKLRNLQNKECKTPPIMESLLRLGESSGNFTQHKYWAKFTVVNETPDMWIVSAPKISRSGTEMGGIWYVSKKNPKRAVFD